MKKLLISAAAALTLTAQTAFADYTFIIPQKPGGGTSVWAQIVATELEPFLDEKIKLVHIPGANDVPGFNKFHNELQFDDKTVMVSHGGNGVSYLMDPVDYNYREYEPIAMMNLTIINGRQKSFKDGKIKFAGGSGMTPDVFAHLLLIGGPELTVDGAKKIFDEQYVFVKGMSGGERRLAFKRGELTHTRENPAAYKKHVESNENSEVWFSQGVFNLDTGNIDADPNFPGKSIREVFVSKWGVEPTGEFWEAYQLVRNFRDVLQKALWMTKDSPDAPKLIAAFEAMISDPAAVAKIQAKTGKYDWIVGDDMLKAVDILVNQINEKTLNDTVSFARYIGKAAVVKEELIK